MMAKRSILLTIGLVLGGLFLVDSHLADARQIAYKQHVVWVVAMDANHPTPPRALGKGCDALTIANRLIADMQAKGYPGLVGLAAGSTTHDATVLYFDLIGLPEFPDSIVARGTPGYQCQGSLSVAVTVSPFFHTINIKTR